MTCQDCLHCRVKYWFMYCRKHKWEWEMLKNSTLTSGERQVRPFLQVPDWTDKIGNKCEFYEGG